MEKSGPESRAGEGKDEIVAEADRLVAEFFEVMDDDLNTADAISTIFELVTAINTAVKDGATKEFAEKALELLMELATVLGLLQQDKEETVEKYIKSYMNILTQALDENIHIKDIEVLTEEEKNTILEKFNDTEHTYDIPENTTLYSLFEEKAKENAEKVCIIANEEEITYKEFKASIISLELESFLSVKSLSSTSSSSSAILSSSIANSSSAFN